MKLFKKYCENITEEEYRASNRRSYSLLKDLSENGPKVLVDPPKHKFGAGLTLGSIVDKKLTNDEYNPLQDFILTDIKIDLSGKTNTDKLLNYIKYNKVEITPESDLTDIYKELEIKRPPVLDNLFYEKAAIVLNENKYLHQDEYNLYIEMVNTFKTHEFTKDIFNPNSKFEVINQAIIFFTLFGVEMRSMLDKLIIDHKNKIIWPYDIKTGTEFNFMKNFYRFKYEYQGAIYTSAIHSIVQKHFLGYTVMPFEFIYLSRANPKLPRRYIMSNDFVEKVIMGYENNGYKTRGVLELIQDIKWYKENHRYDLPRELIESNGVINIITPK